MFIHCITAYGVEILLNAEHVECFSTTQRTIDLSTPGDPIECALAEVASSSENNVIMPGDHLPAIARAMRRDPPEGVLDLRRACEAALRAAKADKRAAKKS